MILIIVVFLLSAICAWILAKHDEEQEKREMAWKLLALAAVTKLVELSKGEQNGKQDKPAGDTTGAEGEKNHSAGSFKA